MWSMGEMGAADESGAVGVRPLEYAGPVEEEGWVAVARAGAVLAMVVGVGQVFDGLTGQSFASRAARGALGHGAGAGALHVVVSALGAALAVAGGRCLRRPEGGRSRRVATGLLVAFLVPVPVVAVQNALTSGVGPVGVLYVAVQLLRASALPGAGVYLLLRAGRLAARAA
jgi:hypothetical protein